MPPALPDHARLLREVQAARGKWPEPPPPGVVAQTPGPGQESVWDYPRPPLVRPCPVPVRIVFAGATIAQSRRALEVCETAGAPVPYILPADVDEDRLRPAAGLSICEWKGAAVYFDLEAAGRVSRRAAFAYPEPLDDLGCGFQAIAGWYGFYPGRVDEAWFGTELASPQPGGVYAGWVTARLAGPIKGEPGTGHW